MFEYEFYDPTSDPNIAISQPIELPQNFLSFDQITTLRPTFWGEHCVECAMPLCFGVCIHYEGRPDEKCKRFEFGIKDSHIQGFEGFPYQAEIQFRQWGKLESPVYPGVTTVSEIQKQNARYLSKAQELQRQHAMNPESVSKEDYRALFEDGYMHGGDIIPDENLGKETDYFIFQAFSINDDSYDLSFELTTLQRLVKRVSFQIKPGFNQFVLPLQLSTPHYRQLVSSKDQLLARIIPQDDYEAHLIVLMAEFANVTPETKTMLTLMQDDQDVVAQYPLGDTTALDTPRADNEPDNTIQGARETSGAKERASRKLASNNGLPELPAEKVKFVCWDLDNTVWAGTLIESNPETLELRSGVRETMEELDRRGIVQMVVSKNQEEDVLPVLQRLGIDDMFVYRLINWNAKSNNIKLIAQLLNINVDTCAFIDDQVYERTEVSESLPCVRVYAETDVPALLDEAPFDVPITKDASNRRTMYQTEANRRLLEQDFSGDSVNFIRSCNMEITIELPLTQAQRERSFELVQRTNQLNLSGKRYEADVFAELIQGEQGSRTLCLTCKDRFGSYGQVGYCVLELRSSTMYVREFAMSCRVMGKYVEHAFVGWLCSLAKSYEVNYLVFKGVLSSRNGLLVKTLKQIGFSDEALFDGDIVLTMAVDSVIDNVDIVHVSDETQGALNADALMTDAYSKQSFTEALVFVPHQDDEVLTCGAGIMEALDTCAGRVAVILGTYGEKCDTRTILADGGTCTDIHDTHQYSFTEHEYGCLRDIEFFECCKALGVAEKAICIPSDRVGDGTVTLPDARKLIETYLRRYPEALIMTHYCIESTGGMAQPEAYESEQLAFEHIAHNDDGSLDWWPQHRDHYQFGAAASALLHQGTVSQVRFFVEFYHRYQFIAAYPNIALCEYVATGGKYDHLVMGIRQYSVWNPEQQRYALGFHSARRELARAEQLATAYSFDVCGKSLRIDLGVAGSKTFERQVCATRELRDEAEVQRERIRELEQELEKTQTSFEELLSSTTYKVGRAIMKLPCAAKTWLINHRRA